MVAEIPTFCMVQKKNENTVLALPSIFLNLWEFPQILRARFEISALENTPEHYFYYNPHVGEFVHV